MHESHDCGSKIVISCIQTNFSRLTGSSKCNYLKTDQIKIQTFWRSRSHQKSFYTFGFHSFGSHCEIFSSRQKTSEIFGDLRNCSEVFVYLRKLAVNFRKFRFCGDEKSHLFYWKKVSRYRIQVARVQVSRSRPHTLTKSFGEYLLRDKDNQWFNILVRMEDCT